jgi:hypothetical protein
MPQLPYPLWTGKHAKAGLTVALARPVLDDELIAAVAGGTPSASEGGRLASTLGLVTPSDRAAVRGVVAKFLTGDHWQDGAGWPVPIDLLETAGDATEFAMEALAKGFTFRNVTRECGERHRDGCVGKPVEWGFVSRLADAGTGTATPDGAATAAQTLAASFTSDLAAWWKDELVDQKLAAVALSLTYAERQGLRLYAKPDVTPGPTAPGQVRTLTATTRPNETPFAAALRLFGLDVPIPGAAAVYVDPETEQPAAIVARVTSTDADPTRVPGEGAGKTGTVYEVSYVLDPTAPEPETITMAMPDETAGGGAPTEAYRVKCGGRLPVFVLERAPILDGDMAAMQRAYNLCLTAMPRQVATSSWMREILTNATVPGTIVEDRDADGHVTRKRFQPDPIPAGPGVRQHVTGLPITDATGAVDYTTPGVHHQPPVAPDPETMQAIYAEMLHRAKQAHVLATGTGEPSGEYLRQARAEALGALRTTGTVIAAAVEWLLETVTAMAEAVGGPVGASGGALATLRAWAQCNLDAGPLPAGEVETQSQQVERGHLSLERHLAAMGYDNPEGEVNIIRADQPYLFKRMKDLMEIAALAREAMVPLDAVGKALSLSPEEQTMFREADAIDPAPQDTGGNPDAPPAPAAATNAEAET